MGNPGSYNIKGKEAISTFTAGLILAEIVSRLIIWFLFRRVIQVDCG
jgi:hypothetical protein